MKTLIIVLLAGLIAGCSTTMSFNPTKPETKASIQFEIGKDTEKLFGKGKKAYTICFKSRDCILWLPEIKELTLYILCQYGEELTHVIHGNWHKKDEVSICEDLR